MLSCTLAVAGVADSISDVVAKVASSTGSQHSPGSLLLIGPPGVGAPNCQPPLQPPFAHVVVVVIIITCLVDLATGLQYLDILCPRSSWS